MKEIGGYFGLEQFTMSEYYPDLIALNSARNALVYLVRAKKIKKLHIPYFLCDSISKVCDREGYKYEYYNIDKGFLPVFDEKLANNEYLYIVNYYGQFTNDKVRQLKEKYGNVIFDNVQAFFQRPVDGIDTLYSCRKFFGVPDGGYLSSNAFIDEQLYVDVSMNRMKHILGRFEGNSASDYFRDFKNSDRSFINHPLLQMSLLTHNILRAINYESVKKKREENFEALHSLLRGKNKLKLLTPPGPYAYPFYAEEGMTVKKKLAEKNIFVPTLWPNVLSLGGTIEKDYSENILPLPCDQRYDIDNMTTVVEEVMKCIS